MLGIMQMASRWCGFYRFLNPIKSCKISYQMKRGFWGVCECYPDVQDVVVTCRAAKCQTKIPPKIMWE